MHPTPNNAYLWYIVGIIAKVWVDYLLRVYRGFGGLFWSLFLPNIRVHLDTYKVDSPDRLYGFPLCNI